MSNGRVWKLRHITRAMVQAGHRDEIFVFGDNMLGLGFGGQAREMRGEPNAIGVPTKWSLGTRPQDYFTDEDLQNPDVRHAIREAFQQMRAALTVGKDVVIPADGLGTGLAQLPTRAPKIHAWIKAEIVALEAIAFPGKEDPP